MTEKEIKDLYNQIEQLYKEIDITKHELAQHIASHICRTPKQNIQQENFP